MESDIINGISTALKENEGTYSAYNIIAEWLLNNNIQFSVEGLDMDDEALNGDFLEDISVDRNELNFKLFKSGAAIGDYKLIYLSDDHYGGKFEKVS